MLADYITWYELLAEFGCSKSTINRWQARRGFPRAVATPGGLLFSKRSIQDWLKKQERNAQCAKKAA